MTRDAANRFRPLGTEREHIWRVRRMARATGLDVAKAQDTGALDQSAWSDMLHLCRSCPDPAACDRWLSQQGDAPVDQAPELCPQHRRFDKLRQS